MGGGEGNPLAFPHSPCEGPLATCPLSHGCRRASSPKGGAKSRLPLWGRWTRVSEDGEGKLPASPAAPVAIALAGACASGTGFFLAAAH